MERKKMKEETKRIKKENKEAIIRVSVHLFVTKTKPFNFSF